MINADAAIESKLSFAGYPQIQLSSRGVRWVCIARIPFPKSLVTRSSEVVPEWLACGRGRYETLTGLFVGVILFLGGVGICYRSLENAGAVHVPRLS